MYYSVDRIEGDIVVMIGDDGKIVKVTLSTLKIDVKEGDCLLLIDGGYRLDIEETRKRRSDIATFQDELFQ